jgi:hypothetical protein
MERLTGKRVWDEAKQDLVHEPGYKYIWERLNVIENILGDEYDLKYLKELVKRDKITNPPDMYNKLPQKEQTVWYWDSYGISKGIVEFVDEVLGEFEVRFPNENDSDIFVCSAWGDSIVGSKEKALEKMEERRGIEVMGKNYENLYFSTT